MKLKIIGLLLAAFVFTGCNTSSNSSNGSPPTDNPGGNDVNELGYDPKVRWTEQGEFSYNHRYSYNGSACETGEQKFGNLAEYCMALQDQKRNGGCALPSRTSSYRAKCGNDFQELNFRGEFYKSGFDSHIQQQCSTNTSVSEFQNLKHYCDFLKDEALHKNCFWTDRNKHFRNKECSSDFSAMPGAVSGPSPQPNPNPNPQPNPTPTPTPLPDPVQEIPIVKELKEHGITTTVDWQSIRLVSSHPMPGEPTVDEKMKVLWSELAANKNEIIKRKAMITEIEVSIYTNFHNFSTVKQFVIDFETKQNQLKDYFPLSDKIQTYENELKIKFSFIHNGSYSDTVSYKPLRQMIALIEKNFADLKSSFGLFSEIKMDSYVGYFSKSQTLTLRRDFLDADFSQYLKLLKPLAPTLNWFKSKGVDFEADFDIEKDSRTVYDAFKVVEGSLPSFEQMVNAGMLKEVTLYFSNGKQHYWSSLKSISLSIDFMNQREVTDILSKLGKVAQLSRDGSVEITVSGSELTDGFIKSFGFLEKFWPKIKTKLSFIKKIELGYESKFYSGLKQLNIGYNSTEAETEKIINEIK